MITNALWEKFQRATIALARSRPIKDRLTEAYRNHLAQISEDELPRELRGDFAAFSRALRRERPMLRGEDAIRATVRKMSNEEAEDLACFIVQMFGALPRILAPSTRGKSSAQVVPLYSAEA